MREFLKEHPGNERRSWKTTGVVRKVVDSRQVSVGGWVRTRDSRLRDTKETSDA